MYFWLDCEFETLFDCKVPQEVFCIHLVLLVGHFHLKKNTKYLYTTVIIYFEKPYEIREN